MRFDEAKVYGEEFFSCSEFSVYRKEDKDDETDAESISARVYLYTLVFKNDYSRETKVMKFLRWIMASTSPYEVSNKFKIRSSLYTKVDKPVVYTIYPKDIQRDPVVNMLIFDCPEIFGKRSLFKVNEALSTEEELENKSEEDAISDNESN